MSIAEEDNNERRSLERIREILFGARGREVEQRIARLEARTTGELAALRDELRHRFSELESQVRDEIEAMSLRLDTEATARVDATSRLARETREATAAIELRVHGTDEASARGQRELRRQLLDMTREVGAQITRARDELFASIEQGAPAEPPAIEGEQADRPSLH